MATDVPTAPPAVPKFDTELLQITTAVLEDGPLLPAVQSLIAHARERPTCLHRATVELLQERLAKGVVRFFASRGWQSVAHLRDDDSVRGCVWRRTPPAELGLSFSPESLTWLMDLTAKELGQITSWRKRPQLTLGDRVLIFLCLRAINEHMPERRLWSSKTVAADGLNALMYPDHFTEGAVDQPDFEPWLQGPGPALLECLQDDLQRRWMSMEHRKSSERSSNTMELIGAAQQAAAGALMDAADTHSRRDLCVFMLRTLQAVVTDDASAQNWIGKLNMGSVKLADRARTYQLALALLHASRRLQKWQQEFQATGYFDEGYRAAQLWKTYWEQCEMDGVVARVESILEQTTF